MANSLLNHAMVTLRHTFTRHQKGGCIMNSDVKTVTAKIYQFPLRTAKTPVPTAKIVYGNCWYHDEAIRAEPTPIKPRR
jgi:hypothetical protein